MTDRSPHGNVPPRKADDNDLRHAISHMEELSSKRFKLLEEKSPGTAARARAHVQEHLMEIERRQMVQEDLLMQAAQAGQQMGLLKGPGGGGGGGESPIGGAGGPGQDPESPKVRNNETERGEGGASEAKSEGTRNSPNAGAS